MIPAYRFEVEALGNNYNLWRRQNSRWQIAGGPIPIMSLETLNEKAQQLLDQLVKDLKTKQEILNLMVCQSTNEEIILLKELIIKVIQSSFTITSEIDFAVLARAHSNITAKLQLGSELFGKSQEGTTQLFVSNRTQYLEILDTSRRKKKQKANPVVEKSGELTVMIEQPMILKDTKNQGWQWPTEIMAVEKMFFFAIKKIIYLEQIGPTPIEFWANSTDWTYATHHSQIPKGMGKIVWDYCFQNTTHQINNKMDLDFLLANISVLFEKHLGRELSLEQVTNLKNKATSILDLGSGPQYLISEEDWRKTKIEKLKVPLSEWIFNIYHLLEAPFHSDELAKLWQNDYIMAIITKEDAAKKLQNSPVGTFALRCCDAVRCISIVVVEPDSKTGAKIIKHGDPICRKELKEGISILARVAKLYHSNILYPNTAIKTVMDKCFTPAEKTNKPGYSKLLTKSDAICLNSDQIPITGFHLISNTVPMIPNHLLPFPNANQSISSHPLPSFNTVSLSTSTLSSIVNPIPTRKQTSLITASYLHTDESTVSRNLTELSNPFGLQVGHNPTTSTNFCNEKLTRFYETFLHNSNTDDLFNTNPERRSTKDESEKMDMEPDDEVFTYLPSAVNRPYPTPSLDSIGNSTSSFDSSFFSEDDACV